MKIGGAALLSYYALSISQINGFSVNHHHLKSRTPISMSVSKLEETSSTPTSRGGRSNDEIERELASGKILEDGPVIDFGSIKDTSSRGEIALANARAELLKDMELNGKDGVTLGMAVSGGQNRRLMGINDEVVAEVGREVGEFANDDVLIQKCAAYLRSKAGNGLFEDHVDTAADAVPNFSGDEETLNSLLREAYVESGVVTEAFAKTFYLGTQLLPKDAQEAIWAVYVWCRRTDEIVDAPRSPDDVNMLTDLSSWEIRLENLFTYGIVEDVLDLPLLDCKIKYPKLPIDPFVDMIRGMLMDIPDLGQDRYDTFEELHLYCYRVAGTVGLMSMPVFGCAPGYTEKEAKEPALSLGVAFQLTNILRDVGEDAVKRGRIYLPREDMEKFGVTEEQIFAQRLDDNYIAMMKFQIERARMYYDRALRGVPMLSDYSRLPVQSSLDCYGKILDKMEENGYDSLTKRAYVSKTEKMMEIPFSWYRTQDISKVFPIPGDKKK
jgi:phytoene synthase